MEHTAKAGRLEMSILAIQTPDRHFLQCPQGYQVQMGRPPSRATRNIYIAITRIRALISLCRLSPFGRAGAFRRFPHPRLAYFHDVLRLGAQFAGEATLN